MVIVPLCLFCFCTAHGHESYTTMHVITHTNMGTWYWKACRRAHAHTHTYIRVIIGEKEAILCSYVHMYARIHVHTWILCAYVYVCRHTTRHRPRFVLGLIYWCMYKKARGINHMRVKTINTHHSIHQHLSNARIYKIHAVRLLTSFEQNLLLCIRGVCVSHLSISPLQWSNSINNINIMRRIRVPPCVSVSWSLYGDAFARGAYRACFVRLHHFVSRFEDRPRDM